MSTTISDLPAPVTPASGKLRPLGVDDVTLTGGFWGTAQQRNSAATIPHAAGWMDRLGWTGNLEQAGARSTYEHRGREFADSEIYKLVEAISWDVARGDDSNVDLLERLIPIIERAQDPDGYLHTLFGRAWQRPRYSDFSWGHELYCFGHFLQAAVAHHRATGDPRLLAVARRLADHVCTMFGTSGIDHVCGHAEIELGLMELARETGEEAYRTQASIFIERRGTGTMPLHEFGKAYWQDDQLVRDADVLRGHAVRALYLAAGAVDVAVDTDDAELLDALTRQWSNTVARRTYVTGGMGSHHMDEAFGDDFVLPPDRSYCETCAGIASIMFSWRLLLATGEARYADLIEQTLYNIVATSPSRDGRSFFYANTLHQRTAHTPPALNEDGVVIRGGAAGRQAWYEVSCCPPNLARTLASIGAYMATSSAGRIEVHQFAASTLRTPAGDVTVATDYPRSGHIRLIVERSGGPVTLAVRIPVWAEGATAKRGGVVSPLNEGSYAEFEDLQAGDVVDIDLPILARFIAPDDRIDAVRGTVAVQRGPEVWALESVDLPEGWHFEDAAVDVSRPLTERDGTVSAWVSRRERGEADAAWPFGVVTTGWSEAQQVDLVRYHDWAERGPSLMRIWMPVAD